MGILASAKLRAKSVGVIGAAVIAATVIGARIAPAHATVFDSFNGGLDNFYSQVLDMIPEGVYGVRLGMGPALDPKFRGDSAYYVHLAPLISFRYKDLIAVDNNQIRVNLLGTWGNMVRDSHWSAGPSLHLDPGRDESDSPKLKGLGDVGISLETGVYVAYKTGPVRIRTQIRQDILNGHGGLIADVDVNSRLFTSDRWTLSGNAQLTWTNGTYTNAFYGVTPTESVASGLPVYQAHAGLHDVSVNVVASYTINRHWSALGTLGLARLLSSSANNPLVSLRGSPNQVSTAAFAIYSF
ncbi:MAG: MipA/OmpV family protein [Rhodospirillaceae bacterium]|nr:MAG: MipA/OmpV family protein [Rhodospirillaceae bacterium]